MVTHRNHLFVLVNGCEWQSRMSIDLTYYHTDVRMNIHEKSAISFYVIPKVVYTRSHFCLICILLEKIIIGILQFK